MRDGAGVVRYKRVATYLRRSRSRLGCFVVTIRSRAIRRALAGRTTPLACVMGDIDVIRALALVGVRSTVLVEDVPRAVDFRRRSRCDGQAVRTIAASSLVV